MAALPYSTVVQKYADWAPTGKKFETSDLSLPVIKLVDGSVDDQLIQIASLLAAFDAILIGRLQQTTVTLEKTEVSGLPATTKQAQVENKWLCSYHDATTDKAYRIEAPTADLAQLTTDAEFLDLTSGVGATLKTQFELTVLAKDTGNAVVLDSVQFVGRNL